MNLEWNTCNKERAISATSHVANTGIPPWSDMELLGALLIGVNIILFTLIQFGNFGFEKGDFKMFYTAAIALRAGRTSDIYNPESYAPMQRQLVPSLPLDGVKPYTHPPYELLLVLPFSFLSYKLACWCWLAVALCSALICGRLMGSYTAVLGIFPFLIVLCEQQDSTLALLILIGCWFALRNERDALAGLILGLALFRFQIVIPLALLLAIWRPVLLRGLAISGIAVLALSVAMVRPAGVIGYWHYLAGMNNASSLRVSAYHMDPSRNVALRGFLYMLLGPHAYLAPVVTVILGLFILGIAWRFMRDRELSPEVKFSFALIAALLLSFHLLTHDLILLSLPFVLLAGSIARWPLTALYVAPIPLLLYPHASSLLALVPMSSLAAMLVLYWGNRPVPFHQVLPRWNSPNTANSRGHDCD